MKPRVQEKLQELEEGVERLRLAAESAIGQLADARAAQEEMRKDHWRQRKELATLSRSAEDFSTLQNENAELRETLGQLRNALHSLLANVKSLRNEYR